MSLATVRQLKEISFYELKKYLQPSSQKQFHRTLYYKKDWAFCMNKIDYQKIKKSELKGKNLKFV